MTLPLPEPLPIAPIRVEIRRGTELGDVEAAWRALFIEAAEPNPFLGPDFLMPLATLRQGRFQVALAWREVGGARSLAGLMPFAAEAGLPLLRPPLLRSFADPFVVNTTPLVAAVGTEAVLAAMLAELARLHPQAVLLLEDLRLEGPVARALAASGRPQVVTERAERAAVRAGIGSAAYLAERVAGKRVRELRRCEKRIADAGRLETVTLWGAAAAPAVEAFLRIEAAGWKGRQGTALASRPRDLAFARAALGGTMPAIAADLMTLDGRPVAAAVHLVAGDEAVAFKCAYDEDWSKASPGALLDLHTLRMVLDESRVTTIDSGALPGHPVEGLWRERIAHGTVLVALDGRTTTGDLEGAARRMAGVEALARRAKTLVKRALGRKSTALRSA